MKVTLNKNTNIKTDNKKHDIKFSNNKNMSKKAFTTKNSDSIKGINLSLNPDTKIKATINAILKNNVYSLMLENGKNINIEINSKHHLKIGSQVLISLKDAQIYDIKPFNNIENLIIKDVKSFINLLKIIQQNQNLKDFNNNIIKSNILKIDKNNIHIKTNNLGDIILKTNTDLIQNNSKLEYFKLLIPNENNQDITPKIDQSLKILSNNNELSKIKIDRIIINKEHISKIFQAIKEDSQSNESLIFKTTRQKDLKHITLSNSSFKDLNITLKNEESNSSKIIELSQHNKKIIKQDSNNEVQKISIPEKDFIKIYPNLKNIIESSKFKEQNKILNFEIKNNEKFLIKDIDHLELEIKTSTKLPNGNYTIKTTENYSPNTTTLTIIDKNNKIYTVPFKDIKLLLNNKINKNIMEIFSKNFKAEKINQNILLQNENIEFSLSIPNPEIMEFEESFIDLDENNNIVVKSKKIQETEAINKSDITKNINHNISEHKNKTYTTKFHKDFIVDTLILLKAFSSKKEENTSQSDAITSLLQDISSQENIKFLNNNTDKDNSWKFITFPYLNDDNTSQQGEILYSKQKNDKNENIINLSFKINFSKIGETIIKLKLNNKNLNINILLSRDINKESREKINNFCNLRFKKSDFWGTVHIIKANNIHEPLLKSKKIIYSNQIINIKV